MKKSISVVGREITPMTHGATTAPLHSYVQTTPGIVGKPAPTASSMYSTPASSVYGSAGSSGLSSRYGSAGSSGLSSRRSSTTSNGSSFGSSVYAVKGVSTDGVSSYASSIYGSPKIQRLEIDQLDHEQKRSYPAIPSTSLPSLSSGTASHPGSPLTFDFEDALDMRAAQDVAEKANLRVDRELRETHDTHLRAMGEAIFQLRQEKEEERRLISSATGTSDSTPSGSSVSSRNEREEITRRKHLTNAIKHELMEATNERQLNALNKKHYLELSKKLQEVKEFQELLEHDLLTSKAPKGPVVGRHFTPPSSRRNSILSNNSARKSSSTPVPSTPHSNWSDRLTKAQKTSLLFGVEKAKKYTKRRVTKKAKKEPDQNTKMGSSSGTHIEVPGEKNKRRKSTSKTQ